MFIPTGFNHQYGIPLIMEVGSLNTKIGFSGKDKPDCIIPSYVQVSKSTGQKSQMDFYSCFAKQNNDPQNILENCLIDDWQGFQTITGFSLGKRMGVNPSQNPLFYIQTPLSTKQDRQKLIQLFFEEYQFNGLFMHKSPVLSTYLFALQSSLVVDIGAQYTHVVPVIEGFVNTKGIVRAAVGGQTITRQLYKNLTNTGQNFNNSYHNRNLLTPSMNEWGCLQIVRQVKHQHCYLLESRNEMLQWNQHTDKTAFELPDNNKLVFGRELFQAPELYFSQSKDDSNFKGIQHLISQSLEKCQPQQRKELMPNIQLIGGGSTFTATPDRLQRQLIQTDFNGCGSKMKVFTTNEKSQRSISSWLGATIMASMRIFDKWIVSRKQYDEHGTIQVEKRL